MSRNEQLVPEIFPVLNVKPENNDSSEIVVMATMTTGNNLRDPDD